MLACKGAHHRDRDGKIRYIGGKIAATLASTSTPVLCIRGTSHGDFGMITARCFWLCPIRETPEILAIASHQATRRSVDRMTVTQVHTGRQSLVHIDTSVRGPLGLAPTSVQLRHWQ